MSVNDELGTDEIQFAYASADVDKQLAITRILKAPYYLASTLAEPKSADDVLDMDVDWKADQATGQALITGLVHIGVKEFGEVWARTLKQNLSHLLG